MRKRDLKINFYVNDEEKKMIKENAEKCGLSIRSYIMSLINGYKPVEQPNDGIWAMVEQLRKIGTNLNQIARKANAYGYIDNASYQMDMLKLEEFMNAFQYKYLDMHKYDKKVVTNLYK